MSHSARWTQRSGRNCGGGCAACKGRFGQAAASSGEVSYVRPHELYIVDGPQEGALAVTLSQALTVGPQVRIEFKRADDGSYVDVEMPRRDYASLRDRLGLPAGSKAWLRARHVTRFKAGADTSVVQPEPVDPAAMI